MEIMNSTARRKCKEINSYMTLEEAMTEIEKIAHGKPCYIKMIVANYGPKGRMIDYYGWISTVGSTSTCDSPEDVFKILKRMHENE